jgi:hypothetical protein
MDEGKQHPELRRSLRPSGAAFRQNDTENLLNITDDSVNHRQTTALLHLYHLLHRATHPSQLNHNLLPDKKYVPVGFSCGATRLTSSKPYMNRSLTRLSSNAWASSGDSDS